MIRQNRMDRLTDKLNARIGRIGNRLSAINKNTNPYRQEPIPPKEMIMDYSQLMPEDIQFARQHFGNVKVNDYLRNIEKLMRGQGNA